MKIRLGVVVVFLTIQASKVLAVPFHPGDLDSTFGTAGVVTTDVGGALDSTHGVALQSDGKLVVAGGAGSRFALLRYDAAGALDPTFGAGGRVIDAVPWIALSVAIDDSGRILTTGEAGSQFGVARRARRRARPSRSAASPMRESALAPRRARCVPLSIRSMPLGAARHVPLDARG
jgi:uncharacterized delta-60 repeat protein